MTSIEANAPATIYTVTATGKTDQLAVERVGEAKVGEYAQFCAATLHGEPCLMGYHPTHENLDIYWLRRDGGWLVPSGASPSIGKGKNAVVPFVLGNLPYVSVYTAENGFFETYAVGKDLSFSQPYTFYRNHELAISKHFTTVKAFVQLSQIVFLGYDMSTGYVALYTASVTPTSAAEGQPPLLMLPAWSHPWAPGWTHFAFFQLGGETFFFKINVANREKVNVNIDHILDTLSAGTIEIGSHLPLPEALELTSVEPFVLGKGEPYFVTYIAKSGVTALNRFNGDCRGWTEVARFEGPRGAHTALPVSGAGGTQYLVFA